MDYTHDEIVKLDRDLDGIHDKWNAYVEYRFDHRDSEHHLPPALARGCQEIIEHIFQSRFEREGNFAMEPEEVGSIMAMFFSFGQYCENNGLRSRDMIQCKCDTITDEDLEKLVK